MFVYLLVMAIFAISIISYIVKAVKKNENGNITNHNWSMGDSLEHEDCDIENGDTCFHETRQDGNYKTCNKCGYKNEKKATRCSVCGHKLDLF